MNAAIVFTGTGPILVVTSFDSLEDHKLHEKLRDKGISKFIACEVALELAQQRYGKHFDIVCQDLHETDDLRILDYNGERAFRNFRFSEFGEPVYYDPETT